MTFFQIIKQDFRFYRRTSGVTLLLAAVCCAILTGAMLVGDSVQHTLRQMAEMRLGEKTQWAMATGDRFFRQELAEELERKTESLMIVPVLALNGILESPDGSIRVNDINVYGVNGDFIQLKGPLEQALDFAVSQSLWARLEKPGEYLLRLQSTSQLSNDMIFTTDSPGSQAWSIKIDSS
ncbi:MAG: hypothetical protein ACYSOS_02145, partial [Planctomycetota bacterium]